MNLLVCPLASVASTVAEARPSHLVRLLAPDQGAAALHPAPALDLRFNDIVEDRDGLVAPNATHIDDLLRFSGGWSAAAPLLVHCWFGISRSPAAAFVILCQRNPATPERRIARCLRRAMPFATPNPLMVALADARLGRNGRMIRAIDDIGRGQGLFQGACVALPVDMR